MRGPRHSAAYKRGFGFRRISGGVKSLIDPLTPRERFLFGALIITLLFLVIAPNLSASTGDVGSLFQTPAKQCIAIEGWQGQEQVSGQPQVQPEGTKAEFNGQNSAKWTGEDGPLTCAGYTPPRDDIRNATTLGISIAAKEGEDVVGDEIAEEITLNTASTATHRVDNRTEPIAPNAYGEAEVFDLSLDGLLEVQVSEDSGDNWQTIHIIDQSLLTNEDPHINLALPTDFASDVDKLAIRLNPIISSDKNLTIWVDSIFITYEKGENQDLGLTLIDDDGEKIKEELPLLDPESQINAELTSKDPDSGFWQGLGSQVTDALNNSAEPGVQVKTEIASQSGKVIQSEETEAIYEGHAISSDNVWSFETEMPPDAQPGKYTMAVTIINEKDGAAQVIEQDFLWGVLALNTNRTVYQADETGQVDMTVLDENGSTVCNAEVTLEITGPDQNSTYTTADESIIPSENCLQYSEDFTPDYSIDHTFGQPGEYNLKLTAKTANGEYSIADKIEVDNEKPIYISRTGPTRVYPPVTYPMRMEVTAKDGFSGTITEVVPESFVVKKEVSFTQSYSNLNIVDGKQYIEWDVSIEPGETISLGYDFDVPAISPAFYLLGPAQAKSGDDVVFEELRQWQIAGDAVGDIAIYRGSGTESITTTLSDNVFDQTVTQGSGFSINGGGDTVTLTDGGHYYVAYNVAFESTGGSNRSEVNSLIDLGGTDIEYGRSTCYIRRTQGANECWAAGSAIIDASASDTLSIESQLTDGNSATVAKRADESGLMIVQLDDTWDYARVTETDGTQTFNSATWSDIAWDNNDELDAGTFSRSGADITLADTGHYLVTTNVMFQNSSTTARRNTATRLTLDGTEVEGTRVTAYTRGTNSTQNHVASYQGIIETTSDDQILRLQGSCDHNENCGVGSITNVANETAITVVKLDDLADYIRLHGDDGTQQVDTNGTISFNAQDEVDSNSFSHSSGTATVNIDNDGDYLFFGTHYADRTSETTDSRQYPHWEWRTGGTPEQWGSFGKYNRGDNGTTGTFSSGDSGVWLKNGLTDTDTIDLHNTDEATGADSTNTFQTDRYAITGVRVASLYPSGDPDTRQLHFRWRDDSTDLNTTGGWLAAEDNNGVGTTEKGDDYRLRMEVANVGTADESAAREYELQWGDKTAAGGSSCSAITTWTGVANTSDEFQMIATDNIDPDGEATTSGLLANSEGYTRVNGEGRESADTTGSIGPLSSDEYTELEYSIEVGNDAITGHTYCFRLYDIAAPGTIDAYSAFPELTIDSADITQVSGLGEAGTFTSPVDGGWTTVNFSGSYTTPVVVGTTNTHNGQAALVFEAQSVTGTSAQMRLCESEGGTTTGCDTHAAETGGYLVIDAAEVGNFDGIEAGTFTQNGQVDVNTTNVNYSETFSATPYVWGSTQTVAGDAPIDFRLTTTSATGFTAGICQQNSTDACDGSHGNETVGWVAIEPNNGPFNEVHELGLTSMANSTWTAASFTETYAAAPVVVVEAQHLGGGQDATQDEARLVTTTGFDVRFCEIDTLDTCDNHNAENMAWVAIESGEFEEVVNLDQINWRFYENTNAIQPTTALGTEKVAPNAVNDGDVIRLRMNLQLGVKDLPADKTDFKLQFAAATDCSAAGTWTDVGAQGSGAIWRGFDNATPADGADITSTLLSDSDINASYVEENDTPLNPNAIDVGEYAEWDYVVENNGAADGTKYCFRMTSADGQTIHYSSYPNLTTYAPPTALYIERTTSFAAAAASAWTPIDLSGAPHNIPVNKVVEIAVGNDDINSGITAGVRSVGNLDNRYIELRESEGGGGGSQGANYVVMTVQMDSDGEIEYYTNNTPDTEFEVLGYWDQGTFVDSWDNFNPGADTTWTNIDLSGAPYNVPVNRVVEITAANGEFNTENQAGIQRVGGPDTRLVDIHEAEAPLTSFSTWTAFAQADENSQIEVYAEDDSEMEFYFSGHWDVQPGHFTEASEVITDPTLDNTWQTRDLTAAPFNVPDEAIIEGLLLNGDINAEANFGMRSNGSGLGRTFDMAEAEGSGRNALRIHTPTDADAIIEILHEDISDVPFEFAMSGYWERDVAPDDPATLSQTEVDDTVIATGDWINDTTLEFKAVISDTETYEALQLCIEVQPLGSSFTTVATQCSGEYAYNGVNVNAEVTITVADQNQYHWQAWVVDVADELSGYVSYGGNLESARDFGVDTIAPSGGAVYDGDSPGVDQEFNDSSLDTLEANWAGIDSSVSGLSGYEYSIGTTPGGTDIVNWTSNGTDTDYIENSLTLNTSQPYYTNVRTTDNAGNVSTPISSDGQFVTPTLSFSTSPSSIDLGNLNSSTSYTGTGDTTLTTSTNAYNGYTVQGVATGLLTSQNGDTIGMFSGGTYASPDEWLGGDTGYGYTSSDTTIQGTDKFNGTPCAGGGNPPCYAPWSQSAPGDIVADHTSLISGTPVVNEQFTISQRVTSDSTQEAGTYRGTVIFTATAIY